jgi:hypothetical protein
MLCKFKGVDGRDIRAFTQEPVEDGRGRPDVFEGPRPGHDDADRSRTSQVGITSLKRLLRTEI